MSTLETARLRLVPLGPEHIEPMARLHADPAVMSTMKSGIETWEQTLRRLEDYARSWREKRFGIWGLFERSTGEFVGECGLVDRTAEGLGVSIRMAVKTTAQGKGYAREALRAALGFAFGTTAIDRVVAVARATNIASRRTLEAAGMTLQREWIKDGTPLVLYACASFHTARRGAATP